ncbi:hypothetical protein CB1_001533056 [Camelus ferus]|nr:hypothetical protein CB1_001533056 [Camelus ferus]
MGCEEMVTEGEEDELVKNPGYSTSSGFSICLPLSTSEVTVTIQGDFSSHAVFLWAVKSRSTCHRPSSCVMSLSSGDKQRSPPGHKRDLYACLAGQRSTGQKQQQQKQRVPPDPESHQLVRGHKALMTIIRTDHHSGLMSPPPAPEHHGGDKLLKIVKSVTV